MQSSSSKRPKLLTIALRILFSAGMVTASVTGIAADKAEISANYTIVRTIPLGSPDKWDFLSYDPLKHRVYVTHGSETTVVDAQNGALVGHIPVKGEAHGVAIVSGLGRGYTDDDDPAQAVAFDLKTLKIVKTIPVAADADAMVYDPASRHVYVISADSGVATAIDPANNQRTAAVKLGGKAESAAADGKGKLFVNLVDAREIVRLNTHDNRIDARWPVAACEAPHGLVMDTETRRLFVSCRNRRMLVVDADNGKVLARLPIGAGTDAAGFDPVRKLAFSANSDATLSVIAERSANDFIALPAIHTAPGAKTMAVDPQTGRIFLVTADVASNALQTGHAHVTFVPGSAKLLFLDPGK